MTGGDLVVPPCDHGVSMLGDDEHTSTTATPLNGGAASALAAGNAMGPALEVEASELRHRTRVWHNGDPRPDWLGADWMQLSEYAVVFGQDSNEILKGCGRYSVHVLLLDAKVTTCSTDYVQLSETTGAGSVPAEKVTLSPRFRARGALALWIYQARQLGLVPNMPAHVSVFFGDVDDEGPPAIAKDAIVLVEPTSTEISSCDLWIGRKAREFLQKRHGAIPIVREAGRGRSANTHSSNARVESRDLLLVAALERIVRLAREDVTYAGEPKYEAIAEQALGRIRSALPGDKQPSGTAEDSAQEIVKVTGFSAHRVHVRLREAYLRRAAPSSVRELLLGELTFAIGWPRKAFRELASDSIDEIVAELFKNLSHELQNRPGLRSEMSVVMAEARRRFRTSKSPSRRG